MQIILNSLDELQQLADLIYRGKTMTAASIAAEVRAERAHDVSPLVIDCASATYAGTPLVVGGDFAVSTKTDSGAADTPPAVDSTGRPWDERIDSSNRGTNADGTWRARRGVAPEVRVAVLAELAEQNREPETYTEPVGDAPTQGTDAEPSATERHPLPGAAEVAPATTTPSAEALAALVEAVDAVAQDLEGGMMDTLNACKAFTAEHGVAVFNAVKNAVAPSENGQGTPVNLLTPAQRRTLQAAVQTYDAYFADGTQD